MELVNVLVTFSTIGDECLRQIALISPRVKVTDVSDLLDAEQREGSASKKELDALLAEAEVIYGPRLPQNLIARAPRLKWIQTRHAGVDWYLDRHIIESTVMMTSVSGIYNIPVAEFVLGLILMFTKQAPLCFQLKQQRQWNWFITAELHSKTVGIVGLGDIGREVARLAKAFNMRVVATRRSVKQVTQARYVDILLPRTQLHRLLSESDFVVIIVPLTSKTKGLIAENEFKAMKSTAYLINVARGGIVDEEALIHALDEHWIAGAGLDVFATEPLPPDSRLWEFPNVILSSHIAASSQETHNTQLNESFCENLRRYLSGTRLLNLVDKKEGY